MRVGTIIVFAAAMTASSPVYARARFVAYEGKDAVSEGRGGTKVVAHGVDFWTTRDPPKRFQVLGIITDKRGTGLIAGDAVGSSSVAAKVKEVGGDAVIVMGQSSQLTGYVHGGQATVNGNTAYGSGWSAPVERSTTRMVVVKYLLP